MQVLIARQLTLGIEMRFTSAVGAVEANDRHRLARSAEGLDDRRRQGQHGLLRSPPRRRDYHGRCTTGIAPRIDDGADALSLPAGVLLERNVGQLTPAQSQILDDARRSTAYRSAQECRALAHPVSRVAFEYPIPVIHGDDRAGSHLAQRQTESNPPAPAVIRIWSMADSGSRLFATPRPLQEADSELRGKRRELVDGNVDAQAVMGPVDHRNGEPLVRSRIELDAGRVLIAGIEFLAKQIASFGVIYGGWKLDQNGRILHPTDGLCGEEVAAPLELEIQEQLRSVHLIEIRRDQGHSIIRDRLDSGAARIVAAVDAVSKHHTPIAEALKQGSDVGRPLEALPVQLLETLSRYAIESIQHLIVIRQRRQWRGRSNFGWDRTPVSAGRRSRTPIPRSESNSPRQSQVPKVPTTIDATDTGPQ